MLGVAIIVTVLQHNTTQELGAANSAGTEAGAVAIRQQQAAVDAFSQTYKFAGYLLLPGIGAALFSDERRQRRSSSVHVQ
ncbi:hypothetical protein ACFTAO_03775 [Paenibacillus rhizoplanae]